MSATLLRTGHLMDHRAISSGCHSSRPDQHHLLVFRIEADYLALSFFSRMPIRQINQAE